jgi:hypothetical protein
MSKIEEISFPENNQKTFEKIRLQEETLKKSVSI